MSADGEEGNDVGGSGDQVAQHSCVAAVIENRAREVGLAILDQSSLKLQLAQFIEPGRAYTSTRLLARIHDVSDFVVLSSDNAQQAFGATGVNSALSAYPRHGLPRGSFDDSKGQLLLMETLADEASRSGLAAAGTRGAHYLAFGAAGALIQHVTEDRGMVLSSGCLTVTFIGTGKHMLIDSGSIDVLEIVQPAGGTSAAGGGGRQGSGGRQGKHCGPFSLLSMMNHTKTLPGARLLRANLLQPLTCIPTLESRYNALQELLDSSSTMVFDVTQALAALPKDLDRVCCNLAIRPTKANADASRRIGLATSSCILLREVLQVLPALSAALACSENSLLTAMSANFSDPIYAEMLQRIDQVIAEEATSSKTAFINRIQQCFAVKPNADSFLDLTRTSFCRITESIHQLAEQYRADFQLLSLKANYSNKRGFYLSIPAFTGKGAERAETVLPRSFVLLEQRAQSTLLCTTPELVALNARLKDAANDCLILTESVLEGLVQYLVQQMSSLQRLVDTLALLDMLQALTQVVSSAPAPYVRPRLQQRGPLAIVAGRHALMERLPDANVRGNDTFASVTCSLNIITGPNMSGKTTYLKQIALAVVMAQVGCFVPAEFMALQPFERLFTHLACTGDSIETNSSSFMIEMQDIAYILDHATASSLVVVDELGRATSTNDGVAIAWAVCECLLSLGVTAFFATHFVQLAQLAELYPAVKLWRLQVDTAHQRLDYLWQLQPGLTPANLRYGLALAATIGISEPILQRAHRVAELAEVAERQRLPTRPETHSEWVLLYSTMHKLFTLVQRSLPTDDGGSGGRDVRDEARSRGRSSTVTLDAQCLQLLECLKTEAGRLPLPQLAAAVHMPTSR